MLKYLFTAVIIALIGGVGFLMVWDIPAPGKTVEHQVPNDKITFE